MNINKEVKTVTLIRTHLERRGKGEYPSPIRVITQFWTPDGELVFEKDPASARPMNPELAEALSHQVAGLIRNRIKPVTATEENNTQELIKGVDELIMKFGGISPTTEERTGQ